MLDERVLMEGVIVKAQFSDAVSAFLVCGTTANMEVVLGVSHVRISGQFDAETSYTVQIESVTDMYEQTLTGVVLSDFLPVDTFQRFMTSLDVVRFWDHSWKFILWNHFLGGCFALDLRQWSLGDLVLSLVDSFLC